MTSCALPKTEPVGDALQSTVLQPIDENDDDDDDDNDDDDDDDSELIYMYWRLLNMTFIHKVYTDRQI